MPALGTPRERRAPSQVRGERHIDDHDAAWCGPCREGPGVPRGDRGGGSCHVGVGRDFLPRVDTLLIRILTRSLHPGRGHSARPNAHTLPHSFRRDTWQANSRKAKVTYSRSCWVKAALWQDGKTSESQVPTSEWLEWNMSWMERGEAGVPRGQDHGVKCSQAGQRKDSVHTTTCATPQTPRFQDSSGWVPICNFIISLSFFLFLLKKKKKKWGWWGTEEDTYHSLGAWKTAGIISSGWGSATTQTCD